MTSLDGTWTLSARGLDHLGTVDRRKQTDTTTWPNDPLVRVRSNGRPAPLNRRITAGRITLCYDIAHEGGDA